MRPAKRRVAVLSSLAFVVCCPSVLFVAGCLKMDQITQLANTADQSKASLAAIAADLKGSCDRQNSYVPPVSPSNPSPTQPCTDGDDFVKLGTNLVAEQSVLLDYFDALGKLASSNTSGFTKSVGTIDTSFKSAGLSTAQQAMASSAGKLASAISDIFVQGYRSRKLFEIIKNTDQDVTTLANGLGNQVGSASGPSYFSLLENEKAVMGSYYGIPLAREPNTLAAILVSRQYQGDLQQLQSREAAAESYQKMMKSLASAHSKLTNATKGGHFDIKQIAQDLGPDVQQIMQSVNALRKDIR